MTFEKILSKIKNNLPVSDKEAYYIYKSFSLTELIYLANEIRNIKHNNKTVTYIIDRNINITNVCFSFCDFCNFCKTIDDKDAYITNDEEYETKINELFNLGGNQLLLQGGMHPNLGLAFYKNLFTKLKTKFPKLYLHALSPSEIIFLAKKENKSIEYILKNLIDCGLDSLPGGGAEILVDRVRKIISPHKASSEEWLNVMRIAHKIGISTTATMMFGHIEKNKERIEHILKIRELQNESSKEGFISFIPWTFQWGNTRLIKKFPDVKKTTNYEYLKIIAISRIILNNIPNIQASWLTVGKETASIALHSGANDLGSIMLEENVVASTGVYGKLSISEMENLIMESGFIAKRRNQKFECYTLLKSKISV